MIDLIFILVLGGIGLFFNAQNDVLKKENDRLRDVINFDRKWHSMDKQTSIEYAIANERYRVSKERYLEFCKKQGDK